MDYVLLIVEWYTTHFASNVVNLADYGFIYGWLAGISGIVAVAAFIAMLAGYERGIPSISLAGQHLLVLGIPLIWGQVVDVLSTGATTAGHVLPDMVEHALSLEIAAQAVQMVSLLA